MQSHEPEKTRERPPFPWKRLLGVTLLLLVLVLVAIVLLLSTGHIIDYSWYYWIPAIFTIIIGPLLSVLPWFFPDFWVGDKRTGTTHATPVVTERPRNFILGKRDSKFQDRPGEFDQLERLLFESGKIDAPPRIGIVGMGGIGKTRLANEIAYRYENRFPAGVFWMVADCTTPAQWQAQFAELAKQTGYLPPNDDKPPAVEREERRARYICRYLADHADALLILDNVEKPNLAVTAISDLVGGIAKCTILYTSRFSFPPPNVTIYEVRKLSEESALGLLLESRPLLLSKIRDKSQDVESQAAQDVVKFVGYLPLALILLSKLLQEDILTLEQLYQDLKDRGRIEITDIPNKLNPEEVSLCSTFMLSWKKIDNDAQRIFKLACCFPEARPVPLKLLGLAAGFDESEIAKQLGPLGIVRKQLEYWSLIEEATQEEIQVHPLLREFGRRRMEDVEREAIVKEARTRLSAVFNNPIKEAEEIISELIDIEKENSKFGLTPSKNRFMIQKLYEVEEKLQFPSNSEIFSYSIELLRLIDGLYNLHHYNDKMINLLMEQKFDGRTLSKAKSSQLIYSFEEYVTLLKRLKIKPEQFSVIS